MHNMCGSTSKWVVTVAGMLLCSGASAIFPDHADAVIAWRKTLGETAMRMLMWENAARFFRLTTTPW